MAEYGEMMNAPNVAAAATANAAVGRGKFENTPERRKRAMIGAMPESKIATVTAIIAKLTTPSAR